MIRPLHEIASPRSTPAHQPGQVGQAVDASLDRVTLGGPQAPPRLVPPGPTTPLRRAFDSLLNVGGPSQVQLLEDNAAAWVARWRTVEAAQDSLDLQYFAWDRDIFGMAMMGHVFQRARQGVATRLMVDATGDTSGKRGFKSHRGGKDYLQELVMTGNVQARVYHPNWKKILDQLVHPGSTAVAASNHDKILLADGTRGITGGRNIGYEYYANPEDCAGAWRDTDIQVEGRETGDALRQAFEVEFETRWITSPVKGDLFGNRVRRDVELLGAWLMMDSWLKAPTWHSAQKAEFRKSEDLRQSEAQALVATALRGLPGEGVDRTPDKRELECLHRMAGELVKHPELRGAANRPQPVSRQAEVRILDKTSSVGVERDQINPAFLEMTRKARHKIVIENPYVVLTKEMIQALREAGQRGVQIFLGTNSPTSTDSTVTQAFFLKDWPRLEATIPNLRIFVATGERKLHAKVAVVDDVLTLVGTYNMDFISERVNSELATMVWSPEFADQASAGIARDKSEERNGAVEYRILRDGQGNPIRSDGKPVLDAQGNLVNEPEVAYGPEDHVPTQVLAEYRQRISRWSFLRRFLPQLHPLDTFRQTLRD